MCQTGCCSGPCDPAGMAKCELGSRTFYMAIFLYGSTLRVWCSYNSPNQRILPLMRDASHPFVSSVGELGPANSELVLVDVESCKTSFCTPVALILCKREASGEFAKQWKVWGISSSNQHTKWYFSLSQSYEQTLCFWASFFPSLNSLL